MPLETILLILAVHWTGDFVFQTNWMATNKSSKISALTLHILQYTLCLFCGCLFAPPLLGNTFLLWIGVNALAHWVVDYFSSRLNKHWLAKNRQDLFWMTIGADQLLHQTCLLGSLALLGG